MKEKKNSTALNDERLIKSICREAKPIPSKSMTNINRNCIPPMRLFVIGVQD
jgi:hypothetical protein